MLMRAWASMTSVENGPQVVVVLLPLDDVERGVTSALPPRPVTSVLARESEAAGTGILDVSRGRLQQLAIAGRLPFAQHASHRFYIGALSSR
jgi:hypothetical protein